jgi:chromosome segregation ATPase
MEDLEMQAELTRAKADLHEAQRNVSAAGVADDEKHQAKMHEWHKRARKHFDTLTIQSVVQEKAQCDAHKAELEAEIHAAEARMEELKGHIKEIDVKKSKIESRHRKMEDDIKAEEKAIEVERKEGELADFKASPGSKK